MASVETMTLGDDMSVILDVSNVTFIDQSALEGVDDNSDLTVCHFILPNDVAGFEEVVGEVELEATWDHFDKASVNSLTPDSGIGGEPNPDVFLTFVDDSLGQPGLVSSSFIQNGGGEVIVEKIYEIKDELFDESCVEIQNDDEEMEETQVKDEDLHDMNLQEDTFQPFEEEEDEKLWPQKKHLLTQRQTKVKVKNGSRLRILTYRCADCNENFNSEVEFRSHMEAHLTKPTKNVCVFCSEDFSSKSQLQEHIKQHFAKNKIYNCSMCNDSFTCKGALKRHRKCSHACSIVMVSASAKCTECQRVFADKTTLSQHLATHAARKPFSCEECGATFTQNGSLQVHLRRHRGEKPFSCQLCGNSFTRAHSLKVHMKTHTGEKPYSCDFCGASFVTSSHLTVHKRTHTGERPYSCGDCGATFITTSHLNVHRRMHTPVAGLLCCPACPATFTDPIHLRNHRRSHHRLPPNRGVATPLACKVCDQRFSGRVQLEKHLLTSCD